jgi:threonine dehydrogenase-like Zn-dependent dehydrogenase
VDAVGMEAHGAGATAFAQAVTGILPGPIARAAMSTIGVDRLTALHPALDLVRRGGTVSLSGVYGGEADPLPMKSMFDKNLTLRMGQCNVRNWIDDLLPLVEDPADPLGVTDLVTHTVPLDRAPEMYETFQKKEDGCIKVVLTP